MGQFLSGRADIRGDISDVAAIHFEVMGEYRTEALPLYHTPGAKLWRCLGGRVYKLGKRRPGKGGKAPGQLGMDYGDAKVSTILMVRRSALACQQRGRAPRHTAFASGWGTWNHLMHMRVQGGMLRPHCVHRRDMFSPRSVRPNTGDYGFGSAIAQPQDKVRGHRAL